jgi:hypothetical protein
MLAHDRTMVLQGGRTRVVPSLVGLGGLAAHGLSGHTMACAKRQKSKPQMLRLVLSAYDRGMEHDADDLLWEAFVTAVLASGPAEERRSCYGDKPALFTAKREIAHLEAPGVIDVRITQAGWSRVREDFLDDPAVRRDPSRRDWIELHLRSTADLDRLGGLLTVAMVANT